MSFVIIDLRDGSVLERCIGADELVRTLREYAAHHADIPVAAQLVDSEEGF